MREKQNRLNKQKQFKEQIEEQMKQRVSNNKLTKPYIQFRQSISDETKP